MASEKTAREIRAAIKADREELLERLLSDPESKARYLAKLKDTARKRALNGSEPPEEIV